MNLKGRVGDSDDDWPTPPTSPTALIGCEEDQTEELEETSIDEDYSLLNVDQEFIENLDTCTGTSGADTFIKIAYRVAVAKSRDRKRSQEEVDEDEEEQDEIARAHKLTIRAYHRLSTRKKRKDYAKCKISSISSFQECNTPVSEEELEIAFSRLILENNGCLHAGSKNYKEFIERSGYQEKMKVLGNPKAFCLAHASRGFQFSPGTTKLGDVFSFHPPQNACDEWMKGHCSKKRCSRSHTLPRGCLLHDDGNMHNKIPRNANAAEKKNHQQLCKYFPNCTRGASCRYLHSDQLPLVLCKNYPDCKYGINCRFLHPVQGPQSPPFPSFDWSRTSGHKKYLVLGTTEEGGTQSFIDFLNNYFNDNPYEDFKESVSNSEMMGRENAHYKFENPQDNKTSLTFVVTPAITDFGNHKKSKKISGLQMALEIAQYQEDTLFSGIVLILNGSTDHNTLPAILVLLNCSVPTSILGNLTTVIINSDGRQSNGITTHQVNCLKTGTGNRQSWEDNMKTFAKILPSIVFGNNSLRSCPPGDFPKMAIREFLHFVKVQVINFESILVKLEGTLAPKLRKTKQRVEGVIKNISDQPFSLNVLQDSSTENTLCSTCGVVCHFDCRCNENISPGIHLEHNCIIFSSGTTCHSCPGHCDRNSHYQSRKTIAATSSSLEKIVSELRAGSSIINLPATPGLQLPHFLEIVEEALACIDHHFEVVSSLAIVKLGCRTLFLEEFNHMILVLRSQSQDPSSQPSIHSQEVIDRAIGVLSRLFEDYLFPDHLENLNMKAHSRSQEYKKVIPEKPARRKQKNDQVLSVGKEKSGASASKGKPFSK